MPLENGWFREECSLWSGYSMCLEVEKVLYHQKSKFQDILVFQSKSFGNVLVLDGLVQCSEKDEFAYQEMIANIPLYSHPSPENVLVIGGGDGGVVREVVKHPSVKKVVLCEIDEEVCNVSKKYLPGMAVGLKHPKLELCIADGLEYLDKSEGKFDVIITDSTDPVGPAEGLFELKYFKLIHQALKPGGIMCNQGENIWLDKTFIQGVLNKCREVFPCVSYASCTTATYACGQIGLILGSKSDRDFSKPVRTLSEEEVDANGYQYYNSSVHTASFTLPNFAHKAFGLPVKS
ncbi:spermidine synthase-like [Argonauta hians]